MLPLASSARSIFPKTEKLAISSRGFVAAARRASGKQKRKKAEAKRFISDKNGRQSGRSCLFSVERLTGVSTQGSAICLEKRGVFPSERERIARCAFRG